MIRTENLTKRYGALTAVDGLTLHVQPGEIYGFLGPNGSGKTTTIQMLLGLTPPSSGRVFLFGQELADNYFDLKRRIGVVAERQALYDEMTAQEYLALFAEIFGVQRAGTRIRDLLEQMELTGYRHQRVGEFSQGMRQKLGLARALLHGPELLILDEPTNGLDPRAVKQVRDLIRAENRRGRTILLSSHLLSEVEVTAQRVGVILHGRLLVEEETQALKRKLTDRQSLEVEVAEMPPNLEQSLAGQPWVSAVRRDGQKFAVELRGHEDYRGRVSQIITACGGVIIGMRLLEASLEDAYLTVTEEALARLAGD